MARFDLRALWGQLYRFGLTTAASVVLSLGLPILLHEHGGIPESIAVAIGFGASFAFNAIVVPLFVFRTDQKPLRRTLIYIGTSLAFRLTEYLAFLALFELAGLDYRVSVFVVLTLSSLTKFFVYRLIYQPNR